MNPSSTVRCWRNRALGLLSLTLILPLVHHNSSSALTNSQGETETCSQARVDRFRSIGAFSYLHPQSDLIATAAIAVKNPRRIEVRWQLYQGDAFWMRDLQAYETQEFAVRYIPSAAEFVGDRFLAVAGCLGESNVIELWELSIPKIELDPATGNMRLTPGTRKSVRMLYRSSASTEEGQRGFARRMIWNRGKPRALFCLFADARDVFELTWPASLELGTTTVIASKAEYPELATNNYDTVSGGEHLAEGFVYKLTRAGALDLTPALVLIDSDRDGAIDVISALDAQGFDALELRDASRWAEISGLDTPW